MQSTTVNQSQIDPQKTQTPLMKQFWEIKSQHMDKILLFRMGDFYEMFDEDAKKAAPILNIALTQRNKKSAHDTAMCGVPHHSVSGPINKLLAAHFKVAICDQVEDPKEAKGIVKRAVTRVLTPGMVYDPETLEESKSNYIAAMDATSVAFFDGSTGLSFVIQTQTFEEQKMAIDMYGPVEIVFRSEQQISEAWRTESEIKARVLSIYNPDLLSKNLQDSLMPILQNFNRANENSLDSSLGLVLSYSASLAGAEFLRTLKRPVHRPLKSHIFLSENVQKHLEIFQNNKGEDRPTFFSCINRAQTSGGRRLLRSWVLTPLLDFSLIEKRQNRIQFWRDRFVDMKKIRELLYGIGDLERRLVKLTASQVNGRDLLSLLSSLRFSLDVAARVSELRGQVENVARYQVLSDLADEIERTIVDEPPLTLRQGFLIRKGLRADLDEFIDLTTDSHDILQKMEAREREATGIGSLKIRYNQVFGYYIEVTNTHKDKVPPVYKRKQTLATAERFYTEELLELEKKILSAQTKRFDLEYEIFEQLRLKTLSQAQLIQMLADEMSELDVEVGLAWLSLEEGYSRPELHDKLILKQARHVVLDQTLKGKFIPNDVLMGEQKVLLLTGPNMAGKSTFMRQVGLISLLHQIGSYVPATEAKLPLFDQIYTRIGANDQLSEGLSTFMVEMQETADLLKKATAKSLVILDEIGRGTATFDGMSLAEAILEHLLNQVHALTFFATHYHELTSLEERFSSLRNAHMSVRESRGELSFEYQLKTGPALKSYGIAVAKLAGLPQSVLQTAQKRLLVLERKTSEALGSKQVSFDDWQIEAQIDSFGQNASTEVSMEKVEILKSRIQEILQIDLNRMTPLQAFMEFARQQDLCRETLERES